MNTSGDETHTHNANIPSINQMLTAVAAFRKDSMIFRNVNAPISNPGNAVAVNNVFIFQLFKSKNLWIRAETYPLTHPLKTYKTTMAVKVCPLRMGLTIFNTAMTIVLNMAIPICAPVPTNTANNIGRYVGGRKTSPWTSFQPVSSISLLPLSSKLLYASISFFKVRIIMIAIAPVRNNTIMKEFIMAKKCISSSGLPKR